MAEDLHSFITGTLWLKLKADVHDLRVFNRNDIASAAYFQVRRLLLIQPGWVCRTDIQLGTSVRADLMLFQHERLQSVLQLETMLTPGAGTSFSADHLTARMTALRQAVGAAEKQRGSGSTRVVRGYLMAAYDTAEQWFYPDQLMMEKQSCFWLPINCHEFADYADWRQKWDKQARLSL